MLVLSESLYPLRFAEFQQEKTGGKTSGEEKPVTALKDFLRNQEQVYLNKALAQTGGDKDKASELLGISLATLYRKLSESDEG